MHTTVGIAVGPCTGGIVGHTKFVFDLWGDVINTASRMQSTCLPGKIQVTQEVSQRLRDNFQVEKRGNIQVNFSLFVNFDV